MGEKSSINAYVYLALTALIFILIFGITYLWLVGLPGSREGQGVISPAAKTPRQAADKAEDKDLAAPGVPGQAMTVEAMLDKEIERCREHRDLAIRQSCLASYINASFDRDLDRAFCERFEAGSAEAKLCADLYYSRLLSQAGENKDAGACDAFAGEEKGACLADYWTSRALEQGSAAACGQAGDPAISALCADKYNALIRLGGTGYDCGIYQGQDFKDDCEKLKVLAQGIVTQLDCGAFKTKEFKRLCE